VSARPSQPPRAARTQRSRGGVSSAAPKTRSEFQQSGAAPPAAPLPSWSVEAKRNALALASLALLTFLAYFNSFSGGFVLDNRGALLEDPRIREFTAKNLGLIFEHTYWWPTGEAGLYRPFTTLSFLFNYAALGNAQNPAGYHGINLLLHLGNVFLVYALVRRLLRSFWPAAFTAALWAVHPALTESVTYMVGRSDLLAGVAVLGGLVMYLRATESAGRRTILWLAGLLAITTVGAFSKESAVVIIALIALYEFTWWKERKPGRTFVLGCVATLVPIAVMVYLRTVVIAAAPPAEFPSTDNPMVGAGFWTGRLTAVKIMARYLALTLWPARLSSDYSYSQIPLFHGSLAEWVACGAVLAFALLALSSYKWNRTVFFMMGFAVITLLPTSNLLILIGTDMAERFLYLPAVGLVGSMVMAIYAAGERLRVTRYVPALLCVVTMGFAVRTWLRNADWQDDLTMAEASVLTSPNSFKVHRQLAAVLYGNGEGNSDLDGAIAEAERSIAIVDSLPDVRNDQQVYSMGGEFYLFKGDSLRHHDAAKSSRAYQRALQLLTRTIAIDKAWRADYDRHGGAEWARRHSRIPVGSKGDPEPRWMLAVIYLRLGDATRAVAAAHDALAYHPRTPHAYRVIASLFADQNDFAGAATALMEGGLITADTGFRADILDLYQNSPDAACALTNGLGGPTLNRSCPVVHQSICAAYLETIKATLEDEKPEVARQGKQDAEQKYGCAAEPFDRVLSR